MSNWDDYKKTMPSQSSLHDLARAGDLSSLQAMSAGERRGLDLRDHRGYTPLMLASYHGHYEFAEWLLSHGANANSVDDSGNSILMGVAFKGHTFIGELLLKNGADLNYHNPKGQNALQLAQMFGRVDMVKFLKGQHNRPQTFGLVDVLKSWSQVLFNTSKGERI